MDEIPCAHITISIAKGEGICGNMGCNKKRERSFFGSVLENATKIQQFHKEWGTKVLVSAQICKGQGDNYRFRPIARLNDDKNSEHVFEFCEKIQQTDEWMYELEQQSKSKMYEDYAKALEAFENEKYVEAEMLFKEFLKIKPQDKPTLKMLEMCATRLA